MPESLPVRTTAGGSFPGRLRLFALQRLPDYSAIQVGQRDIYCLLLLSAAQYAGYSDEDALDLVLRANSDFKTPLPEHMLRGYMATAIRKNIILQIPQSLTFWGYPQKVNSL